MTHASHLSPGPLGLHHINVAPRKALSPPSATTALLTSASGAASPRLNAPWHQPVRGIDRLNPQSEAAIANAWPVLMAYEGSPPGTRERWPLSGRRNGRALPAHFCLRHSTYAAKVSISPLEIGANAVPTTVTRVALSPAEGHAKPVRAFQHPTHVPSTLWRDIVRRTLLALSLLLPLTAFAVDQDINKISDNIRIESGQHADDLSTVSGDIEVGDHAVVGDVNAISGVITVGREAKVTDLGTVSGNIRVGEGAVANGNIGTVSGRIELLPSAQVKGRVSGVSQSITLSDARVGGGIETVSGNITIGAGSVVEGGILVNQPQHGNVHFGNGHAPTIVIGPKAVVKGTLEFRHEVVLKVSDSAQIGTVKGATPEKFSGANP